MIPTRDEQPIAQVADAQVGPPPSMRIPQPADVRDAAISARGLSKSFGAIFAVYQLDLAIPRGAVFGLIGPNGAGKTTTFSMMAGFLHPSEGTLTVLGQKPSDVNALRGRLSVLPQDAVLPPNDKVGPFLVHLAKLQGVVDSAIRPMVERILAEIGGPGWWNTRCGALSHGMAKRVALAQALLGQPEVILLDEPTAGLDPKSAFEVRQIIRARKGHTTLVVSSHNLQELEELCDGAAILDRGRVVGYGAISELTGQSSEIRVEVAPGPLPIEAVRALSVVRAVVFDEARRELVVTFDRLGADAEAVIGQVLTVLLQHQARISGVSKGRGLEQRVMELTS